MFRVRLPLAVMGLLVCMPIVARTQTADTLRITTFGGFLGYLDGFVEFPSGPWDPTAQPGSSRPAPAGGVVGVDEWLGSHRPANGLVLVTGNNMPGPAVGDSSGDLQIVQPTHPFWVRFAKLNADVVAIGTEDVLRGVRVGDAVKQGAGPFAAFVQNAPLKLLASNAIIREHKVGLNTIESGDFTLEVDHDDSVELVSKLTISCHREKCEGPARNGTIAELVDAGPTVATDPAAPAAAPARLEAKRDGEDHLTISLSGHPLAFGRRYAITLTGTPARFEFVTVRALTPKANDRTSLAGLPVMVPVPINGVQPIVLAFVSPGIKAKIREEAWSWDAKSAPSGPPCNGVEKCTLDFLDPIDALKALRPAMKQAAPSLAIAIPDLDDDELVDLSAAAPDLRVVIHPPESWVMGRAADSTDAAPRYSGDLGYGAILNQAVANADGAAPTPERPGDATVLQLWARPEWIGETVHSIETTVSADAATKTAFLSAPKTRVNFIKGAALQYRIDNPGSAAPQISYFVTGVDGTVVPVAGPFRAHQPYSSAATFSDGRPLGNVWTNTADLMAFLLDVAKAGGHTDIAASTGQYVDRDLVAWLDAERSSLQTPIPWLSRFFLSRALFRPERLSRVTVSGKDLAGVLKKMVDAAKAEDNELYIAGVGEGYPLSKVDDSHLRVNDREVDPAHFYVLAVPASLAKAVGLTPTLSTHAFDFFAAADARLPSRATAIATTGCVSLDRREGARACTAQALATSYKTTTGTSDSSADTGLGARFDKDRADDLRMYLSVVSAVATLSRTNLTQPDGIPFDVVPSEGRKAKDQKLLDGSVKADLGFDRPKVVYHGLFTGEYSEDRTLAENGSTTSIKYPKDKYMAGGRFDVKVDKGGIHHYYFGGFDESWFRKQHDDDPITPTREVSKVEADGLVSRSTEQTKQITPVIQRSHYTYGRAGVQFEPIGSAKYAQISKLTFNIDGGRRSKEIIGAMISGVRQNVDDLRKSGASDLVNKFFLANRDAFLANQSFEYVYAPINTSRFVLESSTSIALPNTRRSAHGAITIDLEWHEYLRTKTLSTLSPLQSIDLKTKIELPIPGQVKVAPYYNWYRVKAKDAGTFRITEWGLKIEFPWFLAWGHGHVLH